MPTTSSRHSPPTLDPVALARWQAMASPVSPWLHEEVGRRMQERLDWIVRQPQAWSDWEPVRGGVAAHDLVAARYPKSEQWLIHANPAHARLALERWKPSVWGRMVGRSGVHFQAPAPASMDMVWANMALHQAIDPPALLTAWASWLKDDGFLMFSCLGPDTLKELRALYAQLGWPAPSQAFTDMHDWGDMLVAHGFAEPVMDMEHITLQFTSAERLLQELRELGRNLHPDRFAGLRGRAWRQQLTTALAGQADAQGRIAVNFEIVYGHAFKAPPRLAVAEQTTISLQDMRAELRKR